MFGFVARSCYSSYLMDNMPIKTTVYLRNIDFCIILIRASLQLRLTDTLCIIAFLSVIPALIEGLVAAALARCLFDGMPIYISYSLGYMLALCGTGVALPAIFVYITRGFKVRSIVPNLAILGTTLDNLFVGTVFNSFRNLS